MHFCTAKIAIGNDITSIMVRGPHSPVSWPEIEVLRYIHGESAIDDIEVIADVPQTGKAERARLQMIYGEAPLIALWGGRNTPGEMENKEAKKIKKGLAWMNPITGIIEISGEEKATPVEEEVAVEETEEDPIGDDEPETKAAAKKKK